MVALLLGAAGTAVAHASLVRSDPGDGASLAAPPTTVSLTFNEAISTPAYVVVTAPDGTRVEVGEPQIVDGTVTQPIDPAAAPESPGEWTLAYRVVSVDGHPVTGELSFTVTGDHKPSAPASTSGASPAAAPAGDDEGAWHEHAGHLVIALVGLLVVAVLGWSTRTGADT